MRERERKKQEKEIKWKREGKGKKRELPGCNHGFRFHFRRRRRNARVCVARANNRTVVDLLLSAECKVARLGELRRFGGRSRQVKACIYT